jgi:hypothetical protein
VKHLVRIVVVSLILSFASLTFGASKITIASWNIENFGQSKAKNEVKMAIIATILSQFDVIAVQEISNVHEMSDPGCPRNMNSCPGHKNCHLLLKALKKNLSEKEGRAYEFLFSRQVKDERYLFIYDKNKVRALDLGQLITDDEDTLPICDEDSEGRMVRQPFYATFKAGDFDMKIVTSNVKVETTILAILSSSLIDAPIFS